MLISVSRHHMTNRGADGQERRTAQSAPHGSICITHAILSTLNFRKQWSDSVRKGGQKVDSVYEVTDFVSSRCDLVSGEGRSAPPGREPRQTGRAFPSHGDLHWRMDGCCAHVIRPSTTHCQRASIRLAPIAQHSRRPESRPRTELGDTGLATSGLPRTPGRPRRRRCEHRLGASDLPLPGGYQSTRRRVPTRREAKMAIWRPSRGYVQNSTPILQGRSWGGEAAESGGRCGNVAPDP